MGKNEGFKVEITSDFEWFWCYNILVTCGCFDADDNQIGFASADDSLAPVGANLECKPSDYPSKRIVCFETRECDHLLIYIYVMPHTLPHDEAVDDNNSYMLNVKITRAGEVVHRLELPVNRWSGGSFEVRS